MMASTVYETEISFFAAQIYIFHTFTYICIPLISTQIFVYLLSFWFFQITKLPGPTNLFIRGMKLELITQIITAQRTNFSKIYCNICTNLYQNIIKYTICVKHQQTYQWVKLSPTHTKLHTRRYRHFSFMDFSSLRPSLFSYPFT